VRVLVVDDDPVSRRMLAKILSDLGCEVDLASGGLEGLEKAMVAPPDLLVTDWVMPDMGGGELIRALRGSGFDRPIWFACPRDGEENLAEGIEAGAQAPVHKPFDRDEIAGLLARVGEGG